ncbi:hypothetical protein TKK_0018323 [Trichogramma kaykai]
MDKECCKEVMGECKELLEECCDCSEFQLLWRSMSRLFWDGGKLVGDAASNLVVAAYKVLTETTANKK